mmetsp:Transcript_4132/g.6024  ORF Transcript_4132/g.6024 Transcript_4132/m.6024 type:complete len:91 (-) Transcript_4132:463-735(-)
MHNSRNVNLGSTRLVLLDANATAKLTRDLKSRYDVRISIHKPSSSCVRNTDRETSSDDSILTSPLSAETLEMCIDGKKSSLCDGAIPDMM